MIRPLLQICSLSKSFGGPPAVDRADMTVAAGEIRGIVGESGSGKTTLARCSLRLLKPSSGRVLFDGEDLACLRPAELRRKRREFQMVFQDPYSSLNPGMSVEEILLEPLQVHGIGTPEERQERLRELGSSAALDPAWMRRKPADLSGGQQQRVGIARALALRPRLLVADEPVSALDVSAQAQILNLLSDLKRQYGFTLVLISHSLYAVHYLCSRVSVLYRGRIVEEASAPHFFSRPKHPYSSLLLESMPVLEASGGGRGPRVVRNGPLEGGNSGPGCVFYSNCPRRMKVCGELSPELKECAPGESVACFLYR